MRRLFLILGGLGGINLGQEVVYALAYSGQLRDGGDGGREVLERRGIRRAVARPGVGFVALGRKLDATPRPA